MNNGFGLTAPVIHQNQAKDVLVGPADGNGLPEPIACSDEEGLKTERKKDIRRQTVWTLV